MPLLRRIHGSTTHSGKAPGAESSKPIKRTTQSRVAEYEDVGSPTAEKVLALGDPRERHGGKQSNSSASLHLRGRIFPTAEAEWMQGTGPDSDVVISTRVRLARNILGHTFCHSAAESELQQIAAIVEGAAADVKAQGTVPQLSHLRVIELKYLNAIDREFLIERHLISRDLAERSGTGKVIIGDREVVSIMLNEEDHIRLQVINSGLLLRQSWEMIDAIDNELGRRIDYAFSPDWGYLMACPTNVGTGLRVSVMLHIPALAATKEGNKILSSVSDMGYAVRGMYGEGSQATGAFYQISNEATLGQSEEEIVERIRSVTRQIVDRERDARSRVAEHEEISANSITRDTAVEIEDKIFRSYGTLMNARLLSSREALKLLSWVSLGVNIGVLPGPSRTDIARLLVLTRPAHLQKYEGRKLNTAARDVSRAAMIRAVLAKSQ